MKAKPVKVKCLKCNGTIKGDLRGSLIWCKCKNTGIDQTEHYTRILGEKKNHKIL